MKEIIFEWRTNKKNQRPISKNWFYIYAKVIPTLIRFKIDSHGVNGVQRKRQTSQSTESFTFNHGMWAFKGFEAISNTHLTNIHNPRYRTSITKRSRLPPSLTFFAFGMNGQNIKAKKTMIYFRNRQLCSG